MRISDWSSDVCSSDLPADHAAGDHRKHCMFQPGAKWLSGRSEKRGGGERRHEKDVVDLQPDRHRNAQARKEEQPGEAAISVHEIGRAECGEGVSRYM